MKGYGVNDGQMEMSLVYGGIVDEASGSGPDSPIRRFTSGATRDTDGGKYDYGGFLSALVLKRFAEYMHKHRLQKDGELRSADNWKKGIPVEAYRESMLRHVMDVWLHLEGNDFEAREDLEECLCALFFNVQGLLYETLMAPVEVDL